MGDPKLRDTNYNIHPDYYFHRGLPTPYVFDIETNPIFNEYDDNDTNKKYWINDCDKKKYILDDLKITPGSDDYYRECWYRYASFSPTFSRILCISVCGVFDKEFFKKSFYDDDEYFLIQSFRNHMSKISPNLIIGHNILGFDIPFFSRRAISNGFSIKEIPPQINMFKKPKWKYDHIIDTYDMCKWGGQNSLSLGVLCYELGIPSPKDGGIDGSKIREFMSEYNDIETVVKYCERDVIANFKVFEKIFLSNSTLSDRKRKEYYELYNIQHNNNSD